MDEKILLTGYEPFLEFRKNPSIEACRKLENKTYNNIMVVVEELPMQYAQIKELIQKFIDKYQPLAVICTGVSSSSSEVCVERVAVNIGSADQGPNFGFESLDQILNPESPAAYFSTLPIRGIVKAINANGIPARISNSAGTQGCNLVFYHLMDYLAKKGLQIQAGFIHLPRLPENAIGTKNPSMSLEASTRALEIAVSLVASSI